jgi:acetyltransferase-like isoleucine patch superfamily enzyme
MLRQYRGTIRLGNLVELHERVVLSAIGRQGAPAQVSVGDMTSIWYGTVISARREVTIGSHCAISWNCSIVDDDMHEILELRGVGNPIRGARPVHIEDHVWIGAGSTILKGVTIGRNAIIAAGAIVTHDVPPATLVAGAPARIIRDIAGWR